MVLGVGLLVVTTTVLLAVVASAPQETEPAAGTEASVADPADPARSTTSVPATGAPRSGGMVTVGVEQLPASWDPAVERWDAGQLAVASAVADPLAVLGVDGQVHPELAASLDVAADGSSLDVGLRPGVRFHDGSPLDAAALAGHLEGLRASPLWAPVLGPIVAVEVVDDATVRLVVEEPWPELPRLLTGQAGLVVRPGPTGEPVGTGPFRWPTDGRPPAPTGPPVELVRADGHWRADPAWLDGVTIASTPMPDLLGASLAPGPVGYDLAVLPPGLPEPRPADVPQLLRSSTAPAGVVTVLRDGGALADPAARELVTRALAWSARRLDPPLLAGGEPTAGTGTSDTAGDAGTPDTDLSEDVEGWEATHGPMAIVLVAGPGRAALDEAQRIQSDLAERGIDVTVTTVEPTALRTEPGDVVVLPTMAAPGTTDPVLAAWLAPVGPVRGADGIVARWHSPVAVVAVGSVHGVVGATTPEGVARSPLDGGLLPWAALWSSG